MSDIGHNSAIAEGELRQFVERLERLEEKRKGISDDIRDVKATAKGRGFCVKTINTILKMRKMDEAERQEQEALLELYLNALGQLRDTPLGNAALASRAA
jgi:uncharacterized protein (UPF0335 family)